MTTMHVVRYERAETGDETKIALFAKKADAARKMTELSRQGYDCAQLEGDLKKASELPSKELLQKLWENDAEGVFADVRMVRELAGTKAGKAEAVKNQKEAAGEQG